jgi:predicted ATPase/DNA-binding SARP family transcriptional activator
VRIYLLGTTEITVNDHPIRLPSRKQELLLAYLALHQQPQARSTVATLLWGEFLDKQARNSLRNALSVLHRLLGKDVLLVDRNYIQLNGSAQVWVDVGAFEVAIQALRRLTWTQINQAQVQAALALYRGDLLTGFAEDWIDPLREYYRTMYVDYLLHLTQQARSHSDYPYAIDYANHILNFDPAHEATHQHLIFCYGALGQLEQASRQYERCRRMLADLDAEPASETTALYRSVQQRLQPLRPQTTQLTNLPAPLTSFVGRRREIGQIKGLFSRHRLVTLTGLGGCGKTRLAIQVAAELLHEYDDGVWWVDLAPLTDGALVLQTVATALGVREVPHCSLAETLTEYLHARQLLLVLDNCEHLLPTCAALIHLLLRKSAELGLLVTSREPLRVAGGIELPVSPLSLPHHGVAPLGTRASAPEGWQTAEALQLFAERATAITPTFALNAQTAGAVGQICRALDGLPLAVELAAARLHDLPLDQLAQRLTQSLAAQVALLTTDQPGVTPRQASLQGAIAWSYELLTEGERQLWRRLAVFAGSFDLQAVQIVAWERSELTSLSVQIPAEEPLLTTALLGLMSRLVDRSLVAVEHHALTRRYRLLDTIRHFAWERLVEHGEATAISLRYLLYFTQLAETGGHKLSGPEQADWRARLDCEQDNLRAALHRAVEQAQLTVALRLSVALSFYWESRGYYHENRQWLTVTLAQANAMEQPSAEQLRWRGYATSELGRLACILHDYPLAATLLTQSLALAEATGDQKLLALTWSRQGLLASFQNDWPVAQRLLEQSRACFQALGDEWQVSNMEYYLGFLHTQRGDFPRAAACYQMSLHLRRRLGDAHGMGATLNLMGILHRRQGQLAEAEAAYTQSLHIMRELDSQRLIPRILTGLGELALTKHNYAAALGYLHEALRRFRLLQDRRNLCLNLITVAGIACASGQPSLAAQLFHCADSGLTPTAYAQEPEIAAHRQRLLAKLHPPRAASIFTTAQADKSPLPLDEGVTLALSLKLTI